MTAPAERRGATHVADDVVARIAAHAATEVDGVVEVRRRRVARRAARVTVDGGVAAVRLDVTVAYPLPLRSTADRLRRHVAARVHELTGLAVGHVDVGVSGLVPAREDTRPEVVA